MKSALFGFIAIVLLGACVANRWLDDQDDALSDDSTGVSGYEDVKRAHGMVRVPLCMRWDMPCIPNSRRRFARCCAGMNCSCSLFGGNCRCTERLGRR